MKILSGILGLTLSSVVSVLGTANAANLSGGYKDGPAYAASTGLALTSALTLAAPGATLPSPTWTITQAPSKFSNKGNGVFGGGTIGYNLPGQQLSSWALKATSVQ